MILDFCLRHRERLVRDPAARGLAANRIALEDLELPLGLEVEHLQPVLCSTLFARLLEQRGGRFLPGLGEVPWITHIPAPGGAEAARLLSKGRLLFEHCMATVSHVCVTGFMEHELARSPSGLKVVLDLMAWMVRQRSNLELQEAVEGEAARRRLVRVDYILDQGVSLIHGLGSERAAALAGGKEPV